MLVSIRRLEFIRTAKVTWNLVEQFIECNQLLCYTPNRSFYILNILWFRNGDEKRKIKENCSKTVFYIISYQQGEPRIFKLLNTKITPNSTYKRKTSGIIGKCVLIYVDRGENMPIRRKYDRNSQAHTSTERITNRRRSLMKPHGKEKKTSNGEKGRERERESEWKVVSEIFMNFIRCAFKFSIFLLLFFGLGPAWIAHVLFFLSFAICVGRRTHLLVHKYFQNRHTSSRIYTYTCHRILYLAPNGPCDVVRQQSQSRAFLFYLVWAVWNGVWAEAMSSRIRCLCVYSTSLL